MSNRFLFLTFVTLVATLGVATAPAAELPATWEADLFAAREAAWRGFFGDPEALAALLSEDFIGIDRSRQPWSTKVQVVEESRQVIAAGVRLATLSFPDNVVQRYGDVAIIYTTFSYTTTGDHREAPMTSGRATELFRWNGQRWLHTGWHLGPPAP